MIGVYCITNTSNNKCYIGSTNDLAYRESMHFHKLKYNTHGNKHLQNAYNKYGGDNFEFSVVELIGEDEFTKEYLLLREQYYIDTVKPEYNILQIAGSSLGFVHTEETKAKISSSMLGVKKSEEHAKNISLSQKGKTLTEEHRKKLSEAAKNRKTQGRNVKIIIDDIEYNSLKEASEILNIKYNTVQKRLKNPKFTNYNYSNKV